MSRDLLSLELFLSDDCVSWKKEKAVDPGPETKVGVAFGNLSHRRSLCGQGFLGDLEVTAKQRVCVCGPCACLRLTWKL